MSGWHLCHDVHCRTAPEHPCHEPDCRHLGIVVRDAGARAIGEEARGTARLIVTTTPGVTMTVLAQEDLVDAIAAALAREAATQRQAANHWFTEANREHNARVRAEGVAVSALAKLEADGQRYAQLAREANAETMVAENRVAVLEAARVRAEGERDDIAYRVEHPELAHLHYDGCPYKPWADTPRWEEPEDVPDCTCGEAAKGAYWKGQLLLERMKHDETHKRLAALEAALRGLEGACEDPCFAHCGDYRTEPGHYPECEAARAALAPPERSRVAPAAPDTGEETSA